MPHVHACGPVLAQTFHAGEEGRGGAVKEQPVVFVRDDFPQHAAVRGDQGFSHGHDFTRGAAGAVAARNKEHAGVEGFQHSRVIFAFDESWEKHILFQTQITYRLPADLFLFGAASDHDKAGVGRAAHELLERLEEIGIVPVGLHAGHNSEHEGIPGNPQPSTPIGDIPRGIESVGVHGAGHHPKAFGGKSEHRCIMFQGAAGRLYQGMRGRQQFLVAGIFGETLALITGPEDGKAMFTGGGHGDGMVVIEVAVDHVIGLLCEKMGQGALVKPVEQGVAVFFQVKFQNGLDAAVAGGFDNFVDRSAGIRGAGEIGVDSAGAQGHTKVQGGLGRPRPFTIAEKMKDVHTSCL